MDQATHKLIADIYGAVTHTEGWQAVADGLFAFDLVEPEAMDEVGGWIEAGFRERFGRSADVLPLRAAGGASWRAA